MFYALSWFVVASLLALWSVAAWLLHSAAVWTLSNAGALSGAASGVGNLNLPAWLMPWVSPDQVQALAQWVASLGSLVQGLLQAAPALAGGLTMATGVLWGLGSVLLLVLGVGLHGGIALWRRRGRLQAPAARTAHTAA